jgi:transporter family protein
LDSKQPCVYRVSKGFPNSICDRRAFLHELDALGAILIATGQYQRLNTVSARTYLFLTLSGLATGASWVCYFRALKIGSASLVAPIDKLSVVLVAILGVMFLHEKLLFRNWMGVLLIAVGAVLVGWKP